MSNSLTIITNELILDFLEMKHNINSRKLSLPIKRMILFSPNECDVCKKITTDLCKQYYLTPFQGCVICKKCSSQIKKMMILYALSITNYIIPWKHFILIFNSITRIDFDGTYKVERSNGTIEEWKFNRYDDAPWFSRTTIYVPMKSVSEDIGKSIPLKEFMRLNNIREPKRILDAFECVYL